jgi:hypothetical protein
MYIVYLVTHIIMAICFLGIICSSFDLPNRWLKREKDRAIMPGVNALCLVMLIVYCCSIYKLFHFFFNVGEPGISQLCTVNDSRKCRWVVPVKFSLFNSFFRCNQEKIL